MPEFNRKAHWEHIYQTKELKDVGWYQPVPETSLHFFEVLGVPKTAKIIDVGGGDSLLVDHLLDRGYKDITVVDISAAAIDRAKQRLGVQAMEVNWIVSDVTQFIPTVAYDVWHDRAAFHFLTARAEATHYVQLAHKALQPGAFLIVGTFSDQGPAKCSGIEVQQYSAVTLEQEFSPYFKQLSCLKVDHITPSGSTQNFVFASFQKQ